MNRTIKRIWHHLKQEIPPLDMCVVFFSALAILGIFGDWEVGNIHFWQMCRRIIIAAAIGFIFGAVGWKGVLYLGYQLGCRLSATVQSLLYKPVRAQKRVRGVHANAGAQRSRKGA